MMTTPIQSASHVAISLVAQHPSLDRICAGIEDVVRAYDPDILITLRNAQGNAATASQIAHQLLSKAPDVVVGVGTLTAQALHAVNKGKIPLVFGGVTDPTAAQLIPGPEMPITGATDFPPVSAQISYIATHFPEVRKIGILYNPSEINATRQVQAFEQAAQAQGYIILKTAVLKTMDTSASARKLVPTVDLIYIPNDNTVVSAIETVTSAARSAHIPVFSSDPESVERGAHAAVAHDQYAVGQATGALVVRILQGERAQDIPFVTTYTVTQISNPSASQPPCAITP